MWSPGRQNGTRGRFAWRWRQAAKSRKVLLPKCGEFGPVGKGSIHRLITTSTILEHEISELRLLIERQTGVVLDCPNSALAARVADFIEAQDLDSSTAMLDRLRSSEQDPSSLPSLLDGLVNTNTGFFRHSSALNAFTRQVLPQ